MNDDDIADALLSRGAASAPPAFAFAWTDLSAMVAGEIEPPKLLLDDFLYEGASHWINGHPKHGKTIIMMDAACQLIERGHHVLWLDYESGPRRTARRLQEHGATPGFLSDFFHYQYAPRTTTDATVVRAFEAALDQWPGALVVFDSQAKALRRAGFSEDSADDVTEWTTNLVLHLSNVKDATVVVIDHVVKSATQASNYGRGSSAKAADADVSWYVQRRTDFDRRQRGMVDVYLWHDRDGALPGHLLFAIGDGEGGLPVHRLHEPLPDEGGLKVHGDQSI